MTAQATHEMEHRVREIFPHAQFAYDNEGQLIIYTNTTPGEDAPSAD